ncbi:hypothetical protein Pmani_023194 [Petrolisthes manimaculis]|uniref:Wnt inhibitory factor 1 n=1 Tax=Petrolisthes manimaculis TaxID=1843537 RepID=A0AAE1PCF3_9EUCA|nr:hypothetical protein Pmani_023194 [Petrolisthes manimaculis]
MTVTKDSLPLYNSHSTTTGTISDLSSLTDRHTNTSFEEKANLTKNEPHPSASKIRQHNKRSNRSRGEPGRPSRRSRRPGRGKRRGRRNKGLSLWIDSKQVKTFSGYVMEIFVIHNSRVLPYILDPKFEGQLPVIPAQVESVNFTWRAGSKKYYYAFDHLYSQDEGMLGVPVLSLPTRGRVPRRPRVFSVEMRCTGNASGTTTFGIGLSLHTQQGQPLPGTPLRLQLRKECNYIGPDPECDEKCDNGGVCDEGQRCVCAEGYLGLYCDAALCYPRCMNGGTCTSPGRCSCPPGFNGRHCEGGICQHKCQNGGKCIQKDTCECRRGYYGNQCEFSKCVIPCVNGGRCRDVNMCRCPHGFTGDHCEVMLSPLSPSSSSPSPSSPSSTPARCRRRCRHGSCHHDGNCRCHPGYTGRWCRRRNGRGGSKKKVWI